jgi:hypothetical protein
MCVAAVAFFCRARASRDEGSSADQGPTGPSTALARGHILRWPQEAQVWPAASAEGLLLACASGIGQLSWLHSLHTRTIMNLHRHAQTS